MKNKGWRKLQIWEVIRDGDERLISEGNWQPVEPATHGKARRDCRPVYIIRRKTAAYRPPTPEQPEDLNKYVK